MNNENFICNSRYFFVILQKKLIELYYEENFEIHHITNDDICVLILYRRRY